MTGPITRDKFICTDMSATAPGMSGFGTSVGKIELSPGAPSAFAIPIANTITISNATYSASSSGPMGIDCTPDSGTVCFTVTEGTGQTYPEMWTMNVRTEQLFGTPIRVESLPGTLSITQY